MSLWSWPPLLGWRPRGTFSPLLRGRCRLAWLPWWPTVAGMSACPSPAGRSQRRRVSSAPGKDKPERTVKQSGVFRGRRQRGEGPLLTVAAPLTCTDLLAMDRVPGTRSTDSGASFCFVSVVMTSLRLETRGREAFVGWVSEQWRLQLNYDPNINPPSCGADALPLTSSTPAGCLVPSHLPGLDHLH